MLVFAILYCIGCTKNEETPNVAGLATVTTTDPAKVNAETYTLGGNVTNDGGNSVTERGIVISDEANPTIDDANDAKFEMGSGTGVFTDDFSPFDPGITVHVRAYAKNSKGVAYGSNKTFTTDDVAACDTIMIGNGSSAIINTPTTWRNGNVYVINGDLSISNVLTIEPGVVVKIKQDRGISILGGRINATGNASNRIIFTSYKDDNYCGDSNGDATATTAEKGDWTGIYFYSGSTGNVLTYCDILYAGGNDGGLHNAVAFQNNVGFTIDNCVLAHTLSGNNPQSVTIYGGSNITNNSTQIITNNTFYDNDIPMYVHANYNVSTTNVFHNPANPSQTNRRNAIWLYGTSLSGSTAVWNVTEIPYLVTGYIQVVSPSALTIGANVKVKFSSSSYGLQRFVTGDITFQSSTIFTSYKDDTVGGDSNGDGNATLPATGDWYGFRTQTGNTFVNGANIRYAAN